MASTPPAGVQLPPEFPMLAGPQFLGILSTWGLQGALFVQIYIYHLYFPNDRLLLKLLVYFTLVWETVQTGLITDLGWHIYVDNFGDVATVTSYYNTWFSAPIMSGVMSFLVQIYYAWRLLVLSGSKILVGFIGALAFAQMVLSIVGGALIKAYDLNAARADLNKPIVSSSLIISTVVDIVIAAAMTHFLVRSKTHMQRSDDIVNRLVRLVIETGALTASVALIYAVLFMRFPNNLLFECPAGMLPKLYANTLLVSLNNRAFLRGVADPSVGSSNNVFRSRGLVFDHGVINARSEPLHIDVVTTRTDRIDGSPSEHSDSATGKTTVELVPMDSGRRKTENDHMYGV